MPSRPNARLNSSKARLVTNPKLGAFNAVEIWGYIFWVFRPRGLVGECKYFGEPAAAYFLVEDAENIHVLKQNLYY
jgi:hypothetical protein